MALTAGQHELHRCYLPTGLIHTGDKVPVYEFGCATCGRRSEHLLPLGDTGPRPCSCGGQMRQRPTRVAVKYAAWGFAATDGLVADSRGKDFTALRERAERISDE